MNWLTGKKSYVVGGLMALATGAKFAGLIDEATYQLFSQLLGAAAALTVGHKVVREARA